MGGVEAGLQHAQRRSSPLLSLPMVIMAGPLRSRMTAIPQIGLDDAPAAGPLADPPVAGSCGPRTHGLRQPAPGL